MVYDLGYVLRRSWEITWRHRSLWLFGLMGSLGTAGVPIAAMGSGGRWGLLMRDLPPEVQTAVSGLLSSPYITVMVVGLVLLGLAVIAGLAVLGALGRAALVDQVRAAEDRGRVNLRAGGQAGQRRLWVVFGLRLLLGLPSAGATLAGGLPVAGALFLAVGRVRPEAVVPGILLMPVALAACLTPAICLAVLLSIPFNVLRRLAVCACMLEGLGVRGSIVRSWSLLREHVGSLTLVGLILGGVGIGGMVVIGLPLALVATSFTAVAALTAFSLNNALSEWCLLRSYRVVLMVLMWLSVWLTSAALNSLVETFTSAGWTLTYRELIGLGLTGEETSLAEG